MPSKRANVKNEKQYEKLKGDVEGARGSHRQLTGRSQARRRALRQWLGAAQVHARAAGRYPSPEAGRGPQGQGAPVLTVPMAASGNLDAFDAARGQDMTQHREALALVVRDFVDRCDQVEKGYDPRGSPSRTPSGGKLLHRHGGSSFGVPAKHEACRPGDSRERTWQRRGAVSGPVLNGRVCAFDNRAPSGDGQTPWVGSLQPSAGGGTARWVEPLE